ncbi:hypothetical protein FA15DRAFT_78672 [Coprinopsis marcescibilis]|uniref:Uncharacterized protein n=1 Tax=Coprinopsis marcescibilis TaxID=230819 RepID=A0A5C3KNA5_COPMA|nr:hypothetical protein FA15DRAFT_78672 [Coprinopsis marcescibilis]
MATRRTISVLGPSCVLNSGILSGPSRSCRSGNNDICLVRLFTATNNPASISSPAHMNSKQFLPTRAGESSEKVMGSQLANTRPVTCHPAIAPRSDRLRSRTFDGKTGHDRDIP